MTNVPVRHGRDLDLWDAISGALERHRDRALFDGIGERLDRAHAARIVEARCADLEAEGIGAGNRVIVPTGVAPEAFWLDVLALWRCGAVAIPLPADATPRDCEAWGVAVKAHAIVSQSSTSAALAPKTLPAIDLRPRPGRSPSPIRLDPAAPALILFTSGSTGLRKAVQLSRSAVLGNARATLLRLPIAADDRLYFAIPFSFVSALSHVLVGILAGATLAPEGRRLMPADLIKGIMSARATCFGGSPVQARFIAEAASHTPLPLRWLMSTGDRLPRSSIAVLRRNLPNTDLVVGYGLTELAGRCCLLPPHLACPDEECVGLPLEGLRLSIRRSDMSEAALREEGEVVVDGRWLMSGYLGQPDVTAAKMSQYGFRTGDIGWIGPDGMLRLTGRSDDVFKVAGKKASTIEIAAILERLGICGEFAVLAIDHPLLGQTPRVYYVADRPLDRPAVMDALRAELPSHALPTEFVRVASIPRTGSGKVDRRALSDQTRI